jgi:peptidoglycan/LPS O-acetylase OafA/YrhL
MTLGGVQRWVLSTLTATTIGHFAGGLVLAAVFVDESRLDARIGLLALAAVVGLLAMAAALIIHQRSLLSPWLMLGVVPALIGTYVDFLR